MLIVMRPDATAQDIERVNDEIRRRGWHPHAIPGGTRTAIGITGNPGAVEPEPFRVLPGVADAVAISQPFKLVSREVKPEDTPLRVGDLTHRRQRPSTSSPGPARWSRASRSSPPRRR